MYDVLFLEEAQLVTVSGRLRIVCIYHFFFTSFLLLFPSMLSFSLLELESAASGIAAQQAGFSLAVARDRTIRLF